MKMFLILFLFNISLSYGQTQTRCSPKYDSDLVSITYCMYPPEFRSGIDSLKSFINSNLSRFVDGVCNTKIGFVIDTLGQVNNVCISSSIIREELSKREKRIIAIIESMPTWTPGYTIDKKKIPSGFSIPLNIN